MPIELPVPWIVALNALLWPLIQVGLAWIFLRLPVEWYPHAPSSGNAWFYERFLFIKLWKDRLPDGAAWLGAGFTKRRLETKEPAYLERFIAETWRGEICHWCAFAFIPLFALWNPPWAMGVILAYVIAANLPCILALRYNRIRIARLLVRNQASRR